MLESPSYATSNTKRVDSSVELIQPLSPLAEILSLKQEETVVKADTDTTIEVESL